jgi:hypothetical protein
MEGTSVFSYCCGANEMPAGTLATRTLRKTLAQQAEDLEEALNDETFSMQAGEFPGALIATTIPSQRQSISALKANKFKKVFTFTNPNTGNKVTLWAKRLVK